MRYSPLLVRPMRDEMTEIGFLELTTAEQVEEFMDNQANEGAWVVINSVCGCATGQARPGARMAADSDKRPPHLVTVFAGQDLEATQKMRSYFADVPPSSPSMALLNNGELVYFVPRHRIENRQATEVAADLEAAFERYFSVGLES